MTNYLQIIMEGVVDVFTVSDIKCICFIDNIHSPGLVKNGREKDATATVTLRGLTNFTPRIPVQDLQEQTHQGHVEVQAH